jgi:hypothetical protein
LHLQMTHSTGFRSSQSDSRICRQRLGWSQRRAAPRGPLPREGPDLSRVQPRTSARDGLRGAVEPLALDLHRVWVAAPGLLPHLAHAHHEEQRVFLVLRARGVSSPLQLRHPRGHVTTLRAERWSHRAGPDKDTLSQAHLQRHATLSAARSSVAPRRTGGRLAVSPFFENAA